MSLPYIANLERGRGNPTVGVLGRLAAALDAPLPTLLGALSATEAGAPRIPRSLEAFMRSERFQGEVQRLANETGQDPADLRRRLLQSMAAAPQRSTGEAGQDDWRRLLDAYILLLRG